MAPQRGLRLMLSYCLSVTSCASNVTSENVCKSKRCKSGRWKEAKTEACEKLSPCSKPVVSTIKELLGSFRISSYCLPYNTKK